MAMYLILGALDPTWRLPAETDVVALRRNMRSGTSFEILVEMQDNPSQRVTLTVFPNRLPWWAIAEMADPPRQTVRVVY